ncbi:MAG: DnaJ domain-containing protein [Acidobacteriota bacterium]|nr:DnaJ domain-containing protein [Blastocatellia bacterium]MDW8413241.1 DnaJ domain-containing protein [Acidobacteriota bacterium]
MGIFKKLFEAEVQSRKPAALLVESNDRQAEMRLRVLSDAGYAADRSANLQEAKSRVDEGSYVAVLIGLESVGNSCVELVQTAREKFGKAVIIVYADEQDEVVLLEILKAGANYCIPALEQYISQIPVLIDLVVRRDPSQKKEPVENLQDKREYRGSLKVISVPRLLRSLYQQNLTGALQLRKDIEITLYLSEGSLVFATSNASEMRLGEQMLRNGQITEDELAAARRLMERSGVRFATALTMLGIISLEELKPLVIQHVLSIVYLAFGWTEGEFVFERGVTLKNEVVLSLSTADVIFTGIRRLPDRALIDSWLGDCDRILIPTSDPFSLFQAVTLSKRELEVIERIVEPMSINQIRAVSTVDEDTVVRTLCGLIETGMLVPFEEQQGKLVIDMPKFSELFTSYPELSSMETQTAMEFCYEVESTLQRMRDCSHYAVLGVYPNARPHRILEAYYQLAKKFHPDRHSQLASYHLNLRRDLKEIFERISQAYYVLSDERRRAAYDRELSAAPKPGFVPEVPRRATMPLPQIDVTRLGFQYYHAALQSYNKRQYEEARDELIKAIAEDPSNPEYRIAMARVMLKLPNHLRHAENAYLMAIELFPDNADYYAELGLLYQQLAQMDLARQMMQKALEIDPKNPVALRAELG